LWRSHGQIFVCRNFVSVICKLKPKKNCLKKPRKLIKFTLGRAIKADKSVN